VPSRLDLVSERIRSLLAAPTDGRGAPQREDLEEALTGGYAEALALDGERLRLERKIEQVTAKLARGGQNRPAELRSLMARLDEAEDDLAALRQLLLALRQRAAKAA
jgi:DNA repair exonuclease SbcCD ATPase subunit